MVQKNLDQARVLRTEYIPQVKYLIFSFSVHCIPSTIASSPDIIGWGCIVNDECICLAFKIWITCKGSIVRFSWYFTAFLICRFSSYELQSCGALVDFSKWLQTYVVNMPFSALVLWEMIAVVDVIIRHRGALLNLCFEHLILKEGRFLFGSFR